MTRHSLFLVLVLALWVATSAHGTTLSLTDSSDTRWPGNDVTYTLDFALLSGSTYGATFAITNTADTSPEWYAGWFLFKFDTVASPITNLMAPAGTGPWSILNGGDPTKILWAAGTYQKLEVDGFTGFYATSLAQGPPPADITQGTLLTGVPKTWTFSFDFTVPAEAQANLTTMPFKVGY